MTLTRTITNYKTDYFEFTSFPFPVFLNCTNNEQITDNVENMKQRSNYTRQRNNGKQVSKLNDQNLIISSIIIIIITTTLFQKRFASFENLVCSLLSKSVSYLPYHVSLFAITARKLQVKSIKRPILTLKDSTLIFYYFPWF